MVTMQVFLVVFVCAAKFQCRSSGTVLIFLVDFPHASIYTCNLTVYSVVSLVPNSSQEEAPAENRGNVCSRFQGGDFLVDFGAFSP